LPRPFGNPCPKYRLRIASLTEDRALVRTCGDTCTLEITEKHSGENLISLIAKLIRGKHMSGQKGLFL